MNRHLSNQQSIVIAGTFTDINALKALDFSSLPDYPSYTWAYVEGVGEYYLDRNTNAPESLPNIVQNPSIPGAGRWIKKTITSVTANNLVKQLSSVSGTIGNLTTSTVPEGSNLYFTPARVLATPLTGFSTSNSAIVATDTVLQGLSKAQGQLDAKLNLSGGSLTGTLTLNNDPANPLEAATKRYVDSAIQGLDSKSSVKAATTANITLSGTQTIDGVALSASDRVLVKNQTTTADNGIYAVQSGAWTRTSDMDNWSEIPGAYTFVEQGTVNNNTGWTCTSDAGGTLGTTPITFAQFSSAGAYTTDGQGIVISGNQFSLQLNGSTLSKSGSGLQVAAGGIADTQVSASAAIARTKIASGTANHVIINNGSGVLSSAANITVAQGGTGLTAVGSANQLLGVNAGASALEYKTVAFTNGSVANAANALTLSIPQSVATSASPTFAGMTLNGTGSLQIPNGTTAQRPGSPANGMIRYNSSNNKLEAYENGAWINIITAASGTTDYTFQFTIPGSMVAGVVGGVGTDGTAFGTPMGLAIPVNMTIVDIGMDIGTYAASAASSLDIQIRELTTGANGVGSALTSSSGTLKQTVSYTTASSSGATYHRTKTLSGLSVALTAGNVLFIAVGTVSNCSASDVSLIIRCKQ